MGLRDDDAKIFAERDLLDWARQAPQSSGNYDYAPTEDQQAFYNSDVREWLKNKPSQDSGYDDRGR